MPVMRPVAPVLAALVLAGCSSAAPAAPRHGTTTPARTTPATTQAPTPPPVSTDTAACVTGRCEVRVSAPTTISFKPGLQLTDLRVTSIRNGTVTIVTTSTYSGGEANVYAGGGSCSSNGDNATTTNAMEAGCVITNNRLSMTVLSVAGDSAVLRLAPVS